MSQRRKKSGGQAIVLVTLGLLAMCGMMGLAVDLGWSFFVQKQAQAAADAAALGAVAEGISRLGAGSAGFTCPVGPSGNTAVYCTASPNPTVTGAVVNCSSLAAPSNNLWNGCLYAANNGFIDGGTRQKVTIQAYDGSVAANRPTWVPGVNEIAYWVTVRTAQTVPQLFSAILRNNEGIVSAISTAAILNETIPGSFIALNRRGDCMNDGGNKGGSIIDCGMDADLQGAGSKACPAPAVATATLCGGAAVILSSTCNHSLQQGCGTGSATASGTNYTARTGGGTDVYAGQNLLDQISGVTGAVEDPNAFTTTPVPSTKSSLFQDPTHGKPQPSIAASGAIDSCPVTGGTFPNNATTLGPFQYYAVDNQGNATGAAITLDHSLSFASNGTCPSRPSLSAGANQISTQFPAYVFYGGLVVGGNNNYNFGAGQYVMVGTNDTSNTGYALKIGNSGNPTIVGNGANSSDLGTQFITTAPEADPTNSNLPWYPGLQTQIQGLPAAVATALTSGSGTQLYQGSMELKTGNSASVTLYGVNKANLPSSLASLGNYDNSLFWQDRKNSYDEYNHSPSPQCSSGTCTSDDGTVVSNTGQTFPNVATAAQQTENRVTPNSPSMTIAANGNLNLNGHFYQPRGAWFVASGGSGTAAGLNITVTTGAIRTGGSGQLTLLPSAAPYTTYTVALIQ